MQMLQSTFTRHMYFELESMRIVYDNTYVLHNFNNGDFLAEAAFLTGLPLEFLRPVFF